MKNTNESLSSQQNSLKPGDLFRVSYTATLATCCFMFDLDDDNYIMNINSVQHSNEPVMFLKYVTVRKASKTSKAYYININAVKILYKNQIKHLPMNHTEISGPSSYFNPACKLQMKKYILR